MRIKNIITATAITIASITFFSFNHFQDCEPLTRQQLRAKLVELGYTVGDLETEAGKEKFEVKTSNNGLNIPIAVELSASGNYIWLTVLLGPAAVDNGAKSTELLRQNGVLQPCQFYITSKNNLMMGLPIENRGVSNSILKTRIDFISGKVGESKTSWQ